MNEKTAKTNAASNSVCGSNNHGFYLAGFNIRHKPLHRRTVERQAAFAAVSIKDRVFVAVFLCET